MDGGPGVSTPADPAPALDQGTLRRRARLGVIALGARTVVQQLLTLGGNIYLARILGPGEFGTFWIVQFALSFFVLFGDAGFGAALIQKKGAATQEELSSVFWAQTLLGLVVVTVVAAFAPVVVRLWPGLPQDGVWMLRALSFGLLLTTARVVPAILLERELLFGRLAFVDLVLTASFYGVAVLLASRGHGSQSLIAAVLAQGVAGTIAAYALRPWRPSARFSPSTLRPILRFGLTFQAKHVVGFFNAAVMPLYAGSALGPYVLGIVTWSQNTAFIPLRVVEILARVNFPLLSRLQHDRRAFADTVERTVQVCATVTLFFVALFLGLGPAIVGVVYGDKWLPALPTLYVFAVAISIGFVVPVMSGVFDALGMPHVMMRLGVFWTVLNWVAVFVAMHVRAGALPFTLGYSVHIVVGNGAVILTMKRLLPDTHLWPRIRAGIVTAAALAAITRVALLPWAAGPLTLMAAVLLALGGFIGLLRLFDRQGLELLVQMVRRKPEATA